MKVSDTVPHAISVFFNPAANDVMMEATIKDILDKLGRGAELLESESIALGVVQLVSTAADESSQETSVQRVTRRY